MEKRRMEQIEALDFKTKKGNDHISKLYELIGEMTVKRVEKEKETKLSRRTLKMISLTRELYTASKYL